MRLAHGLHLACCIDLHQGESWAEAFAVLRDGVLALRDRVCRPGEECGLSLRLGERTALELSEPPALAGFQRWLARERCYVFTLDDGVGQEAAEHPDWTHLARLAHTCRLLDLLGELLPKGVDGSVSTLPDSFQGVSEPTRLEEALRAIYAHLIHAAVHAAEVSGRTGRSLRLALEPAPQGLFEHTAGAIRFLEPLVEAFPNQFGVCFHVRGSAGKSEEPVAALAALDDASMPVVKLRLDPAADALPTVFDWLAADPTRCHHLEVETRAGEILSGDGPTREYARTLACLQARGLA